MKLYGYWRSSAAYRLRIAFGLKGLNWSDVHVDLLADAQKSAEYMRKNPIGLVPTVELVDGTILTQSVAILEWLEEVFPTPPLLPPDAKERAHVRAAAHTIVIDTHPIQNSGVVKHLKTQFETESGDTKAWMAHWMHRGFSAFQNLCRQDTPFAFGEQPGFADVCLVPQLYNAHRWGVDLALYPRLTDIENACLSLPAFEAARPENQPDAD